eukprot:6207403-Pleurochrysis_carterae.AAC.5
MHARVFSAKRGTGGCCVKKLCNCGKGVHNPKAKLRTASHATTASHACGMYFARVVRGTQHARCAS